MAQDDRPLLRTAEVARLLGVSHLIRKARAAIPGPERSNRLHPHSSIFPPSHPTRLILRPFSGGRNIPLTSVESVTELAAWVRTTLGGAFGLFSHGRGLWIISTGEALWVEENPR